MYGYKSVERRHVILMINGRVNDKINFGISNNTF